jgi:hypothetical protein
MGLVKINLLNEDPATTGNLCVASPAGNSRSGLLFLYDNLYIDYA